MVATKEKHLPANKRPPAQKKPVTKSKPTTEKKQEKKTPRVFAYIPDLMPIVDYTEDEAFIDNQGNIIDILQIRCMDLNAAKEYDVLLDVSSWLLLYKSYPDDIKVITMNYPPDTYSQTHYIDRILERTENPVFRYYLEKEREYLIAAHEMYDAREFYLMTFSADAHSHKKNINRIHTNLGRNGQVQKLRFTKKVQILRKMANMNTQLGKTDEFINIPRGIDKKKQYNPHLLAAIQPQGGVSFRDEGFIRKGDGYEACIHVYDFPSSIGFNWLSKCTLFENTIATIDIATEDRLKAVSNITKSIEEQRSRIIEARYETERFDAQRVYAQLEELHTTIMDLGEVVKLLHVRVFSYARTREELEDRVGKIVAEIESNGYKSSIFLDESSYEWQSLFQSQTNQGGQLNSRAGVSIPAHSLSLGHPYHFSSLSDPYGSYWGYTSTNGTVLFDPFQKDKQRLSYGKTVMGLTGAGKSTFLKEDMMKNAIMGNYVRGFTTNSEFDSIVKELGGIIINLDGSDGFMNILQVDKTDEDEDICFVKHIDKVATFYKFVAPSADDYDITLLQEYGRILYEKHMGYRTGCNMTITGREPTEYPIFSDFLELLERALYMPGSSTIVKEDLSRGLVDRLEKICWMIRKIVKTMGKLFNGHSSMRDFFSEQVVFFSTENIADLDSTIFDGQLYNAMNKLKHNCFLLGAPQKDLYDRGEIEVPDMRKFVAYIDESHRFVNALKPHVVRFLDGFQREARKYMGGLVLASQSPRDFIPDGSTQEGIDALKNLFSLSQYKIIFKQAPDALESIRNMFGDDIPDNDLQGLPKFNQGECILSITGVESVRFNVDISDENLALFTGGA